MKCYKVEFDVAIVMMVGLGFLGVIGYKAYSKYASIEFSQKAQELKHHHEVETAQLAEVIHKLKKGNENYAYKIKKLREGYDIDYDDVELSDEEDEGTLLSDIAKAVYPKLPPSLGNLLDKEEFQNAIVKTVEKKPDILNTFIDKFLNKPAETQPSNAPALTEKYL